MRAFSGNLPLFGPASGVRSQRVRSGASRNSGRHVRRLQNMNFTDDLMKFESVFNMGSGMILSISKTHQKAFEAKSKDLDLEALLIGEVIKTDSKKPSVIFK